MLDLHCIDNRTTTKILYMNILRTYSSTVWDPMQDHQDHAGILPRATSQLCRDLAWIPLEIPFIIALGSHRVQTQTEPLEGSLRFV